MYTFKLGILSLVRKILLLIAWNGGQFPKKRWSKISKILSYQLLFSVEKEEENCNVKMICINLLSFPTIKTVKQTCLIEGLMVVDPIPYQNNNNKTAVYFDGE